MNSNFLVKFANVHTFRTHKMANNTLNACRNEEVFLNQTHTTTIKSTVIRIEIICNTFNEVAIFILCPHLLMSQHAIIREIAIDFSIPKSQGINGFVMITNNRYIIRYGHNNHCIVMNEFETTLRLFFHVRIAIEFDIDGFIRFTIFPSKSITKPVIRNLNLLSLNDFLLKETILIANTATMTSKSMCCQ